MIPVIEEGGGKPVSFFLLKFHLIFYFLLMCFFFFWILSSKTCPLLCSANENRWGKVMLERALEGHREEKYDDSMCHTPTCSCRQPFPTRAAYGTSPWGSEGAGVRQEGRAIRERSLRLCCLENLNREQCSSSTNKRELSPEAAAPQAIPNVNRQLVLAAFLYRRHASVCLCVAVRVSPRRRLILKRSHWFTCMMCPSSSFLYSQSA